MTDKNIAKRQIECPICGFKHQPEPYSTFEGLLDCVRAVFNDDELKMYVSATDSKLRLVELLFKTTEEKIKVEEPKKKEVKNATTRREKPKDYRPKQTGNPDIW